MKRKVEYPPICPRQCRAPSVGERFLLRGAGSGNPRLARSSLKRPATPCAFSGKGRGLAKRQEGRGTAPGAPFGRPPFSSAALSPKALRKTAGRRPGALKRPIASSPPRQRAPGLFSRRFPARKARGSLFSLSRRPREWRARAFAEKKRARPGRALRFSLSAASGLARLRLRREWMLLTGSAGALRAISRAPLVRRGRNTIGRRSAPRPTSN